MGAAVGAAESSGPRAGVGADVIGGNENGGAVSPSLVGADVTGANDGAFVGTIVGVPVGTCVGVSVGRAVSVVGD